jgi:hypothetical protein
MILKYKLKEIVIIKLMLMQPVYFVSFKQNYERNYCDFVKKILHKNDDSIASTAHRFGIERLYVKKVSV